MDSKTAGKIVESTPDLEKFKFEGTAWMKAIGNFVDVVRGKGKLVVQPEQSLRVIKILEAIAKSAASGQEVKL